LRRGPSGVAAQLRSAAHPFGASLCKSVETPTMLITTANRRRLTAADVERPSGTSRGGGDQTMIGTSHIKIRAFAALGALLIPAALAVTAGNSHATDTVRFSPAAVVAAPTPNCPTDSPKDGNENKGYGDLGNENDGNCDVGNGNTDNNSNGNANGPSADTPAENAKCTGSTEYTETC
jgi:hypothetical protein